MRIGIISDTHDDIPMIKATISKLNELDVSLVLHAGDYISPFTARPYSELKAKMIGVYGNNCAEREKLKEVYAVVGKEIKGNFAEVEAGGRGSLSSMDTTRHCCDPLSTTVASTSSSTATTTKRKSAGKDQL